MWPGRTKALQAARVDRGLYKCNGCKKIFTYKDKKSKETNVHVDHIESVIPLDGKIKRLNNINRMDWNLYIDRLFVPPEKYQILCVQCHSSKTLLEDQYRAINKRNK